MNTTTIARLALAAALLCGGIVRLATVEAPAQKALPAAATGSVCKLGASC